MKKSILLIAISCMASLSLFAQSTIEGTVFYKDAVPRLPGINMSADPNCEKMHSTPVPKEILVLGEGNTMANIFIQIKNPPQNRYMVPNQPVVIDQKGCLFVPHVAAAMQKQEVLFKNSDGILHNIHGLSKVNREFNIGMPPSLTEKVVVFEKQESMFLIKDDVHPWKRMYLAIMGHPYYAVTNTDGTFQINHLPAGTYTIEAWHEKLGTQTATITVGDNDVETVDFSFKVPKRK